MAYYDQFPKSAETAHDVTTVYFETKLFPQSFRDFTIVWAIIAIHYLLILLITTAFITSTQLATLGDNWQWIAQVISPATESLLAGSSSATDKEVRRHLQNEGRERETAGTQPLGDHDRRIGLISSESRHADN